MLLKEEGQSFKYIRSIVSIAERDAYMENECLEPGNYLLYTEATWIDESYVKEY